MSWVKFVQEKNIRGVMTEGNVWGNVLQSSEQTVWRICFVDIVVSCDLLCCFAAN